MLLKSLPANQRDQAFSNMAREDSQLKQNLVHWLTEVTWETNIAFGQISESIVSEGNSIGNGLALIARALGGLQQNSNSSYFNQHNSNAMYANQYSNAMQTNFRHGASAMQGSNMLSFKNSSIPFFPSQVASCKQQWWKPKQYHHGRQYTVTI